MADREISAHAKSMMRKRKKYFLFTQRLVSTNSDRQGVVLYALKLQSSILEGKISAFFHTKLFNSVGGEEEENNFVSCTSAQGVGGGRVDNFENGRQKVGPKTRLPRHNLPGRSLTRHLRDS